MNPLLNLSILLRSKWAPHTSIHSDKAVQYASPLNELDTLYSCGSPSQFIRHNNTQARSLSDFDFHYFFLKFKCITVCLQDTDSESCDSLVCILINYSANEKRIRWQTLLWGKTVLFTTSTVWPLIKFTWFPWPNHSVNDDVKNNGRIYISLCATSVYFYLFAVKAWLS